jgi:hypothetical protein
LTLPGGGFVPPSKRQRGARDREDPDIPFYQASHYTCHVTTIRLPENTETKYWGFNSTFDTKIFGRAYYRMMDLRDDGTIRMIRSSRIENPEITPEHAQNDNDRIDDFDNSKAIIAYDPTWVRAPRNTLPPVPATYEIDWAGANVPCLSDKARRRE